MNLNKKIQDVYYRSEAVKDSVILFDLEKIADEHAINFYDYCETISGRLNDREITIYEAMEIYKKEKSL